MPTPVLWGSEFLVGTTINFSTEPAANFAALKDGGFVSVWVARDGDGTGNAGIRGQMFNADGTKRGVEFGINEEIEDVQNEPSVAVLKDGRFVVAYTDHGDHDGDTDSSIRVRVFSPTGEAGEDFIVNTWKAGSQRDPSVTALENGGFVVGYDDGFSQDVMGQAFNRTLGHAGDEVVLNGGNAALQSDVQLTGLSNGSFVALYTDQSQKPDDDSGVFAIRGRILLPNGQPDPGTGEFLVPTSLLGSQYQPSVTALGGGRFVAVWTHADETGDGSGSSIMAQIFEADGDKHGSEFRVNVTTAGNQFVPTVTALKDGGFAVAYLSDISVGHDLRLTTFDKEGRRTGGEIVVGGSPNEAVSTSRLTTLADGRLIVQWEDWANENTVHARIVDPRFSAVALTGTGFNDQYVGTASGDVLAGAAGSDRLRGEGGNDTLDGGAGADVLDGGAGIDFMSFASSSVGVRAGLRLTARDGDRWTAIEGIIGSGLADTLIGTGASRLRGGAGNDTYQVRAGDLVSEGVGQGRDTLLASTSYVLSANAEVEVLKLAGVSSRVSASLTGSAFANQLFGHAGKTTLKAGAGHDQLRGGLGSDTLWGQGGRDAFVFDTKPGRSNVDVLKDFSVRDDSIWLENKIFTKIGSGTLARPKTIAKDAFVKGTAAQDAQDRIIYDARTGKLYYDRDGTGSAEQVHFATLSKNPKMTSADFLVI